MVVELAVVHGGQGRQHSPAFAKRSARAPSVYFGDDVTDEDVFRHSRPGPISGSRSVKARPRLVGELEDTGQVAQLLVKLYEARRDWLLGTGRPAHRAPLVAVERQATSLVKPARSHRMAMCATAGFAGVVRRAGRRRAGGLLRRRSARKVPPRWRSATWAIRCRADPVAGLYGARLLRRPAGRTRRRECTIAASAVPLGQRGRERQSSRRGPISPWIRSALSVESATMPACRSDLSRRGTSCRSHCARQGSMDASI